MVVFLLSAGTIAVVTGVGYSVHDFVTFRRALAAEVAMLGDVIASNSTASLAFNSVDDGEQILSALAADRRILAAALYTTKTGSGSRGSGWRVFNRSCRTGSGSGRFICNRA